MNNKEIIPEEWDLSEVDAGKVEETEVINEDVVEDTVETAEVVEEIATEGVVEDKEKVETTEVVEDKVTDVVTEDKVSEVNDESALKFLNEKLGTSFKDLSEFTNQDVIDDELREVLDWKKKTNRSLMDFVKFNKDYDGMDDLDVVREAQRLENPELSDEELDFYIEDTYAVGDDYDEDASKRKKIALKINAAKGRKTLNDLKLEFKTSPKSESLTPEMLDDLKLAKEVKDNQVIDQKSQNDYADGLKKSANVLKSLKVSLPDDIVLDYKVDNAESTLDFLNKMPHWHNQDGSWNFDAIVNDGTKLKNMDEIIKLAFEQGKASAIEGKVKSSKGADITAREISKNDVKSDIQFLDENPFSFKTKQVRIKKR